MSKGSKELNGKVVCKHIESKPTTNHLPADPFCTQHYHEQQLNVHSKQQAGRHDRQSTSVGQHVSVTLSTEQFPSRGIPVI